MKSALISPDEPRETGYRVAEVCDNSFEVASPLFWVQCSNNITASEFWYDPSDQQFKLLPIDPPQVGSASDQPTTSGTQTL